MKTSNKKLMCLCEFVGCKNKAILSLKQIGGKNQELYCCDKHAPEWAKTGSSIYYDVIKYNTHEGAIG